MDCLAQLGFHIEQGLHIYILYHRLDQATFHNRHLYCKATPRLQQLAKFLD